MGLALAAAGGVVLASAAAAQTPQPYRPPPINANARFGTTAEGFQRQLANEAVERDREGQGGQPAERTSLIERVWPLVAEGRCEAARQMVREEGDRALARRIGQICVEGRPTPLPSQ